MGNASAAGIRHPGSIDIVPAQAALGAEVRIVDLTQIDDAMFDRLHDTWLEHLLLVFRGQRFTAEDLVTLVRRFGTPVTSSALHKRSLEERIANKVFDLPPEVTVVTNVKQDGKPVGILGDGEVVWHSDFSFKEAPTAARMLLAVEIPPAGGMTYFTNCYAAYDTLPDAMKRRLSGMTIKQANIVDTAMQVRPGASLDMDIREVPGPSHPVISTHPETGRNMIFLGRRHSAYVNGLSLEDSEALLDELWAHATRHQLEWFHEWRPGDLLMWDNRCAMHRREPFDPAARRFLHRVVIKGTKPYGLVQAMRATEKAAGVTTAS